MDQEKLKKVACEAIDKAAEDLHELSQNIWNNPELCFQEKYAHETISAFLEKYGFPVERNFVLETAFKASVGETKVSMVTLVSL